MLSAGEPPQLLFLQFFGIGPSQGFGGYVKLCKLTGSGEVAKGYYSQCGGCFWSVCDQTCESWLATMDSQHFGGIACSQVRVLS